MRTPLTVSVALHAILACFVVTVKVAEPPADDAAGVLVVTAPAGRGRRPLRLRRVSRAERKAPDSVSLTQGRSPLVAEAARRPARAPLYVPRDRASAVPSYQSSAAPTARPVGPAVLDGSREHTGLRRNGGSSETARRVAEPLRRGRAGLSMSTQTESSASPTSPAQTAGLELKTPLDLIAENLLRAEPDGVPIDLVFLLDISQSMQDNIYAVARHLEGMAARLDAHEVDFQVGMVTFHHSTAHSILRNAIKVTQPTDDVAKVRKKLRDVKCSGGEKALNALMEAIHRVKFRAGASRRFVFVTDEYVDGDYPTREVSGALYRARIHVDVIGMDEPFQRSLAAESGGMWIPIASLTS
jgi:Mg-chelatase subunit ChlD